jgi:4-amino-4-deoxy-L-arabinose transferase-like glycosyltransferase
VSSVRKVPALLAGAPYVLAVVACLAAFVGLTLWEMHDESTTYDEGSHLAAAYTAAVLGDHRLVMEQPPLGRRVAALPLLFGPVRLPAHLAAWHDAEHFQYGFAFLFQSGNDADRLLRHARLAMLSWGVLLLLSVHAVARELFGRGGGLLALIAAAFNPNLLAHAHLVTTDVPVAALMFLAVAAFVRWLEVPSAGRCAAAGLLGGGAVATKLSALALGPLLALALLLHLWRERRRARRSDTGAAPARPATLRRALGLAGMMAIAWATLWGAYGFRYAASAERGWEAAQHLQYGPQGFTGGVRWMAEHRLLPEAFLAGVTDLRHHAAAGHWGYAMGSYSQEGWWWYLPFAFLVKNPLAWLALVGLGVAAWWRRRGTDPRDAPIDPAAWPRGSRLPPWGLTFGVAAAGFLGIAMTSPLAMGVRHLLPVFPFAMVAAGAAWSLPDRTGRGRVARLAAGLLSVALMIECLAAGPHQLGFFNAAAAAAAPRHRVLLDSNLDWGQDLKLLRRYMDEHGIGQVKLAYFGTASPRQLGLEHEVLPAVPVPLYVYMEPEWRSAHGLAPGDYLAVSAFCLDKVLEGSAFLSEARPVASIGASIFLYRVPEAGP